MSRSSRTLPCISHRDCMYHRDYNASSSDGALNKKSKTNIKSSASTFTFTSKDKDTVTKKRKGNLISRPSANPKIAPIQRLPTELLLSILAYLGPSERASCALSCRSFATILGPDAWPLTSKAKGSTWRRHDEFLDILERDLNGGYWRCPDCVLFHPYTRLIPKQQPSTLITRIPILKSTFGRKESEAAKGLALGNETDPVYVLTFDLVKAVMDRHIYGAPHGACLNSLKCRSKRVEFVSKIFNVEVEYDFVSKIVLDHLLLRSTYTFRIQRSFAYDMPIPKVPINQYLDGAPFMVCGHVRIQKANNRWFAHGRCSYCPTMWTIRTPSDYTTRLSVFQNLGMCRSAQDMRWKHIKQPKSESMIQYPWDKENVEEAFDRILCSTLDEFKKQLEMSDGRGSWYDPALQKRSYMTLPESLALALPKEKRPVQ